jgi:hypothetical protein
VGAVELQELELRRKLRNIRMQRLRAAYPEKYKQRRREEMRRVRADLDGVRLRREAREKLRQARLADPAGYLREIDSKQIGHSTKSKRRARGLPVPTRPCPGKCELCGSPISRGKLADGSFVIDHDHATGAFRGWLCHPCNYGLGMLGDTVEAIERAAAYMRGDLFKKN